MSRLRRKLALLLILLLGGCIKAGPPGNTGFGKLESVGDLEGVYQNLGEGKAGASAVYLSALIWPQAKDHAAISTVEVKAVSDRALLVRALGAGGVLREETFIEGKDFEIRSGRIRLKENVGFIGWSESQGHALGPSYEREELGLDRRGHGRLSKSQAIAGLVMMVPVVVGTREDVRFVRIK